MFQQQVKSQNALQIDGTRTTGRDVREQNVSACVTVANIVKSSLGPQGLDKMLVDDIGEITVTNDGATILKQLEIQHPAANVLLDSSFAQDEAVGDGTTSVVIFAAELLKRANKLIKNNIHPTNIISGFKLAAKKATQYIDSDLVTDPKDLDISCFENVARTTMSSKVIGPVSKYFSAMIVKALRNVKVKNSKGKDKYPLSSVIVLKKQGKRAKDSVLLDGFALNCTRASQAMPKIVKDSKIALLDFGLQREKMKLGVNIVISDPSKLKEIQDKEISLVLKKIDLILASGANVVLTTGGIDSMCTNYLAKKGIMGVRRCDLGDLRKIARLSGGTLISSLTDLEGNDSYGKDLLGKAKEVVQTPVAGSELIYISGCKTKTCQSIILRGPNELMLDEMSRTVHDALCTVKRVLESNAIVPGGGCVEAALSIYLETYATSIETREQLAIDQFAEALLVIPKTLSINAALDSTELTSKLRAYHNDSQKSKDKDKKEYKYYGLDLENGKVVNNLKKGVVEPALTKIKFIQYATEAAITILRIDDLIKLNPKPEPERPN